MGFGVWLLETDVLYEHEDWKLKYLGQNSCFCVFIYSNDSSLFNIEKFANFYVLRVLIHVFVTALPEIQRHVIFLSWLAELSTMQHRVSHLEDADLAYQVALRARLLVCLTYRRQVRLLARFDPPTGHHPPVLVFAACHKQDLKHTRQGLEIHSVTGNQK